MIFICLKPQYKIVIWRNAAKPWPEMALIFSGLQNGAFCAPRWGWGLWRFASLIPSGCRLPPIHKVMGDHASRGSTPAGAFAVTWQKRGMETEWKREGDRMEKKDKNEGVKWTRMKTRRMERKRETQ